MRALFLMHGAPGVGKSTLIKDLGVSSLALGYDMFRELFSAQIPCVEPEGSADATTLRLSAETERAAVAACQAALTARMNAGATIFMDATFSKEADQTEMAKLAHRYGYQVHLVDCQGSMSLEALLARNVSRGPKRVDEQALADRYSQCAAKPRSPFLNSVIDGTRPVEEVLREIRMIAEVHQVAAPRFMVVGDVHSCAEALDRLIAENDTPETFWVFAGDLFDRGPNPLGVWNLVQGLISQNRAALVEGNHERNLRAVNKNTAQTQFRDTRTTRNALLEAGIMAQEQVDFVNQASPVIRIAVGDGSEPRIVTHGGVGTATARKLADSGLLFVCDVELIYGLGYRGDTYRGKTSYQVQELPLAGNQLHGHRNGRVGEIPVEARRPGAEGGEVICLEAGASTGGHIRAALISREGVSLVETPDLVSDELAKMNSMLPWARKSFKKEQRQSPNELLERMRASEHVNVKPIEDLSGVFAANFTRKAFHQGAWDDLTVHARGLFVDEGNDKVAARGYEKFFHIGEAPGRDLNQWKDQVVTQYPVTIRKKYNGYLALVSSVDGELVVFSKSGITSYSRYARDLLETMLGKDGTGKLGAMLERTGTTAVFEVLALGDTHPITEPGPERLVLLDCIRNEVAFSTDDKIRAGIAARFGIDVAETVEILASPSELDAALERAAGRTDEGVVLVDARGYRSKVKAEIYASRKMARGALERLWRGSADTLGPRFAELESRLGRAGILSRIADYTVRGVDGVQRLDLARVFDHLETVEAKAQHA